MSKEHEKELSDFANRAADLARKIHQDWGSAVEGGVQVLVKVDMPTHGPDHALLNVESQLGAAISAIEAYLTRPV